MKAAVVGTGFIGPVHVEALGRLGVVVEGVLGSSPEKSKAAAKSMNVKKGYSSYEELLADPEVSCVHLASPNTLHFSQAKAALEAGKHVVCEKPLAMNSKESGELVRLAKSRPKQIAAVNYNIRFYPLNLELRDRLAKKEAGEIFHLRGAYEQDWLLNPDDFNWRVLAEEGGDMRALGDIGTHWLDLIGFLTGLELESVCADLKIVHPKRYRPLGSVETFKDKKVPGDDKLERQAVNIQTEDYGSVLLRFVGGARGVLTVSQVTAGRKNRLSYEIAAAKEAYAWDSEAPNHLWIGHRDAANGDLIRDPSLLGAVARPFANYPGGHNEGFPDTFKQLYRAVYDDIRQGRRSAKPLYATFEDGDRELRMCEAVLKSSRQGSWVKIEKGES
jgi:predicted dehydrogenase